MPSNAAAKLVNNDPNDLQVEVFALPDYPGDWGVEAIDVAGDGRIWTTIFSGPDSKARAEEYAQMKYGAYRPTSS